MVTSVRFYFVYCFLFVTIAHDAHGKFVNIHGQRDVELGPRNTAVYQMDSVQLECATDGLPSANVQWFEYATTGAKNLISNGYELVDSHPNRDRYSLSHPNSHNYNLNIADVNMTDAGYYECEDSNNPTSVLGAQLIVLESQPVCNSTTYPSDTGTVIEGIYYTIECTQNFNSTPGIHPLVKWTGPEPFSFDTSFSQNSVWSSIQFYANRSMGAQNWIAKTHFTDDQFLGPNRDNSAPSYTFQWSSVPAYVLWPPKNMYATPQLLSYVVGQTITCYADAKPAPKYVWLSYRTGVQYPGGEVLLITPDMVGYQLMRCTASNYINNKLFTGDYFIDVCVDPISCGGSTPASKQLQRQH